MADRERKGLIARWLEGKERSEEYARSTLPTSRWGLFWDILKGRFGRLMLTNLLMLLTFLPLILIIVWRYLAVAVQGTNAIFGAGLGVGYPAVPDITGQAEMLLVQADLFFFGLMIPASAIAALGVSGGAYIIRNLIWTEGIFVANDFLRGIKRNYLNVLEALLVFTALLFFARTMGNLADFYMIASPGSSTAGWMMASKIIGYIFVAFSVLLCFWMISLGINYKQGPWSLFRNAVVMTIGTFPQTVFFAAIASWPIFLAIFGNGFLLIIAIIILLLFGFSYTFLVWMDFSQWAFDRFINPTIGVATGRGLYNKDKQTAKSSQPSAEESAAMREYKRMIVAQGKSKLACRPIKPLDDEMEVYQLPESFSRDDLRKLRESKEAIEDDVKAYEDEHKNDEQYVEYNRQFEERERALQEETAGKKKKPPRPPKMLNKR
jgi:hypothetical protein